MSKASNSIEIDLDLESEIFTRKSVADLVVAIMEYLLFQRNQIPFMYPTFKILLSNIKQSDDNVNEYENYTIQKQREMALTTLDAIKEITNNLFEEFQNNTILTARVLFGSTSLTPREVYIIKLPNVERFYFNQNYNNGANEKLVKQALMRLLTSQSLYTVFSNNMSPTNTFVDLEVQHNNSYESKAFFQKEYIDPPHGCKTVFININHKISKSHNTDFHGGNMKILEDIACMKIDEDIEQKEQDNSFVTSWLESKSFIKGLKETKSKNRSIWHN